MDNWEQVAIDKLGELNAKYRSLQVFLDACVKCGACTDKCHFYLGTADPKNMPVARQDLLRSVYRRYYTLSSTAVAAPCGTASRRASRCHAFKFPMPRDHSRR